MRRGLTVLALMLVAMMLAATADAQFEPDDNSVPVGVIEGTDMTHDEFRARANAQLEAVALNAVAYRVLNGEYPESLYQLYNSQSWNIDLYNMFNGEPIDAIMFTPGPEHMTSSAEIGLPFSFEYTPPITPVAPAEDGGGGESTVEYVNPAEQLFANMSTQLQVFRVDPSLIHPTSPGDIFYYAEGELLQLVMFSPDGLYVEHFDPVPNGRWKAKIGLKEGQRDWQQDVLAAQVLFFSGEMLPQLYNHVQYMAELPTLTYSGLQQVSAANVLLMAEELDLVILNPSTRQPIAASDGFSRGNFLEPAGGSSGELTIGLQNGRASTLQQLYEAYASTGTTTKQSTGKPAPLGGRR